MAFDGIVSKEAQKLIDLAGYVGYEVQGKPDGFNDYPSGGFRWGVGGAFPSRNFIRLNAEINGTVKNGKLVTPTTALIGTDQSRSPASSITENLTRATLGVTIQSKGGLFGGVGVSWNMPTEGRVGANNPEGDVFGDYYDVQVRIGYHPGQRVYAPPPPPPPRLRR